MLDALISAGANLLGGLLNRQSQSDFNQQQLQTQMAIANQNIALQKEFAQHGIQWKVDDAKAAGLHPLIGAGAQAQSFSPVSVGTGGEAPKFDFGSLGQDLSRAAKAMSSDAQREAVDQRKSVELDLESKALDNDIKRQSLASRALSTSRSAGQLGPPVRTGNNVFDSGDVPLAHLDRGTQINRNWAGQAVEEKKLEQAEAPTTEYRWHRPFGYWLPRAQWIDDGQVTQNAWGEAEIMETAKAAANMIADHVEGARYAWRNWKGIGPDEFDRRARWGIGRR